MSGRLDPTTLPPAGKPTDLSTVCPQPNQGTYEPKRMPKTTTNWKCPDTFRFGVINMREYAPPPRDPIKYVNKEYVQGSEPNSQPGYTAGRKTLPNGIYTKFSSTRRLNPMLPDYPLSKQANPLLDIGPKPNTEAGRRPNLYDNGDIPGSAPTPIYVRKTKHDNFYYNDVPKNAPPYGAKRGPRRDVLPPIDIGKQLVGFYPRNTYPTNPVKPEYDYDASSAKQYSTITMHRGTAKKYGMTEIEGGMTHLARGGTGGFQPDNPRRYLTTGVTRLATGQRPFLPWQN